MGVDAAFHTNLDSDCGSTPRCPEPFVEKGTRLGAGRGIIDIHKLP